MDTLHWILAGAALASFVLFLVTEWRRDRAAFDLELEQGLGRHFRVMRELDREQIDQLLACLAAERAAHADSIEWERLRRDELRDELEDALAIWESMHSGMSDRLSKALASEADLKRVVEDQAARLTDVRRRAEAAMESGRKYYRYWLDYRTDLTRIRNSKTVREARKIASEALS